MRLWVLLSLVSCQAILAAEKPGQVTIVGESVDVLVSTKKVGKYETGCTPSFCAVYVRIQNKSDQPFSLDLPAMYMKTPDGKALAYLSGDDATAILIGKTAVPLTVMTAGSDLRKPIQQSGTAKLQEKLLPVEPVPPTSYIEGVIFFRGSGDKKSKPTTLHIPSLSQDPIPLVW